MPVNPAKLTHSADIFCESQFIYDVDQLQEQVAETAMPSILAPEYVLQTSGDLEFTRAHFYKSVKHGIIALDERVFQIYTPSLLHAKSAIQQYKLKEYLLNDFDPLTETDSNSKQGIGGANEGTLGSRGEALAGLTGASGDSADDYGPGGRYNLFDADDPEDIGRDGAPRKKNQNEINLTSLSSLVQATNLTARQVREYAEVHKRRLFEVKTYTQIENELEKIRKKGKGGKEQGEGRD